MILASTSDKKGTGVLRVKRGADAIFDEKSYRPLFPSRALVRRRFERIYLAYRAYQLLDQFGYRTAKQYRRQRHSFWNCLWLLHMGITGANRFFGRASVRRLREIFDRIEAHDRGTAAARRAVMDLTRAVWSSFRKARRRDAELWSANNFFKSQFGNKQILLHAFPRVRNDLRRLGDFLASS
jgi:hypothetical protein